MTTYYVDEATGSDSNDGLTIGNAWKTTTKVNSTLTAGDTAEYRNGTYNQQILPANSGTSDSNRITYKNYSNEQPEIKDLSENDAIYYISKNYITVQGFKIDGQSIGPNANFKHWLYSYDSDHNEILDCILNKVNGWYGLRYEGTSSYNRIENNLIDHCGEYDSGGGVDYGNALDFKDDADYNLIKGNTFMHGGHDLLEMQTSHNVVRNNYFNNDYSALEGAGKGNRNCSIKGKDGKLSRNLIENNYFLDCGRASDSEYPKLCKIQGTHVIARGNVLDTGPHIGFAGMAPDGTDYVKDLRICHNVILNVGGPGWAVVLNDGGTALLDNHFYNNIIYGTRTHAKNNTHDCDILIDANNSTTSGHSFRGCEIKGNSVVSQTPGDAVINIRGIGKGSVTFMQDNYSANVANNVEIIPDFLGNPLSIREDYYLNTGSPLLSGGVDLTNANGSGSTSTTLTVDDALWFMDGWGVPTVSGDSIIVGSNSAVTITNINYSTNVLTLDTAISWSNNDPVNLEYAGSAPNIGLTGVESGGSTGQDGGGGSGGGGGETGGGEAPVEGTPGAIDDGDSYTAETGSNRLLVWAFATATGSGGSVRELTAITYGAQAMTIAHNSVMDLTGSRQHCTIAYVKEADIPTGSNAFDVTWDSSTQGVSSGTAYTLTGVDQTDPVLMHDSLSFEDLQSPSVQYISDTGSFIVGVASVRQSGNPISTVDGFTEDRDEDDDSVNFRVGTQHKEETTGTTANWNPNLGASGADGNIAIVIFKPESARGISNFGRYNSVRAGETGVTATGVGFSLPIISATLGGETVTITGTPTATEVIMTIPAGIDKGWDSTDNQLVITDQTGAMTVDNITIENRAGWSTKTYAGPSPIADETQSVYEDAISQLTFTLAIGDVIAFETNNAIRINGQSVVTGAATISYKIWDTSLSTWTAEATKEWVITSTNLRRHIAMKRVAEQVTGKITKGLLE